MTNLNSQRRQSSLFALAQSIDGRLALWLKPFNPFFNKLVEPLDPLLAKLVIYALLASSLASAGAVVFNLIDHHLWPHTLTLVAGNQDGESYKLAEALNKALQRKRGNLQLKVTPTDGSETNLAQLRDQTADLGTAQADVVSDTNDPSLRAVATLYSDHLQLLVNKKYFGITDRDTPDAAFTKFIQKLQSHTELEKIETPLQGGQQLSFIKLAEHYGLKESTHFQFTDFGKDEKDADREGDLERAALMRGTIQVVFRVRALGNQEISKFLKENTIQLLPIEQTGALAIKNPTFQPNVTVPKGTYQGSPAVPAKDMTTLSIQRLLLTRKEIPAWQIQVITQVLNDHRKEIAEASTLEVKPLTAKIGEPGIADGVNVPLHPGAQTFYRRHEPPFIKRYLDFIILLVSLGSFAVSLLWKLNARLKKERLEQATKLEETKKDQADQYIGRIVELMSPRSTLDEYMQAQQILEHQFQEASTALRKEEITQEGFRTFNEAYKTSREFIERAIEEAQRQIASTYIEQTLAILDVPQSSRAEGLLALEGILQAARQDMLKHSNFSRESFRTFIETYQIVGETLQRQYPISSN